MAGLVFGREKQTSVTESTNTCTHTCYGFHSLKSRGVRVCSCQLNRAKPARFPQGPKEGRAPATDVLENPVIHEVQDGTASEQSSSGRDGGADDRRSSLTAEHLKHHTKVLSTNGKGRGTPVSPGAVLWLTVAYCTPRPGLLIIPTTDFSSKCFSKNS